MKHCWKGVAALLLCLLLFAGCAAPADQELNSAVQKALLAEAEKMPDGECASEGHILLQARKVGNQTKVWLLTTTGRFGFVNGNFEKISGTGVIPAVMTFEQTENGLVCQSIQYPKDGAAYTASLRRIFPVRLWKRVLEIPPADAEALWSHEELYARLYLQEIGRAETSVGAYADFPHVLLTDLGVSVDVANTILLMKKELPYAPYPDYVGQYERLEDGVRMVYSTSYQWGADKIIFTKTNYETGAILEQLRLDSKSGADVTHQQEQHPLP